MRKSFQEIMEEIKPYLKKRPLIIRHSNEEWHRTKDLLIKEKEK